MVKAEKKEFPALGDVKSGGSCKERATTALSGALRVGERT